MAIALEHLPFHEANWSLVKLFVCWPITMAYSHSPSTRLRMAEPRVPTLSRFCPCFWAHFHLSWCVLESDFPDSCEPRGKAIQWKELPHSGAKIGIEMSWYRSCVLKKIQKGQANLVSHGNIWELCAGPKVAASKSWWCTLPALRRVEAGESGIPAHFLLHKESDAKPGIGPIIMAMKAHL